MYSKPIGYITCVVKIFLVIHTFSTVSSINKNDNHIKTCSSTCDGGKVFIGGSYLFNRRNEERMRRVQEAREEKERKAVEAKEQQERERKLREERLKEEQQRKKQQLLAKKRAEEEARNRKIREQVGMKCVSAGLLFQDFSCLNHFRLGKRVH